MFRPPPALERLGTATGTPWNQATRRHSKYVCNYMYVYMYVYIYIYIYTYIHTYTYAIYDIHARRPLRQAWWAPEGQAFCLRSFPCAGGFGSALQAPTHIITCIIIIMMIIIIIIIMMIVIIIIIIIILLLLLLLYLLLIVVIIYIYIYIFLLLWGGDFRTRAESSEAKRTLERDPG